MSVITKTENLELLPSVNTVLDVYPKGYGFQQWLKDLGSNSDEVLRRAGEQGTNVHNAIQSFLDGQEVTWTMEKRQLHLRRMVNVSQICRFLQDFQTPNNRSRKSLVDPELGFGGTLDYICKIKDEIWLIDWKSGSSIYKGNKIQISAYQKLWNKLNESTHITRLGCAHLRSATRGSDKYKVMQGAGWKIEEVEDPDHMFNLFKHAQVIWAEENPNSQPKNIVYPDKISIELVKNG